MIEQWINPIAWDLGLVERLRIAGWSNFQVDCEGGAVDEGYMLAMAQLGKLGAINPIFRFPPTAMYLFEKAVKFGARRLLLSGGYTTKSLNEMVRTLDQERCLDFSLFVMLESAEELENIREIASLNHVVGFHFGLYDLSKSLDVSEWRDATEWEKRLLPTIGEIKKLNKRCGSYCLPEWEQSSYLRQLDVQSYSIDEFCKVN